MSNQMHPFPQRPVAVAALGLSARMTALFEAYVQGPGARVFKLGNESDSQALLVDLDSPGAREAVESYQRAHGRPAIVLAMRDPGMPDTYWVPKPIDTQQLQAVAVQLAQHQSAPAPSGHAAVAVPAWAGGVDGLVQSAAAPLPVLALPPEPELEPGPVLVPLAASQAAPAPAPLPAPAPPALRVPDAAPSEAVRAKPGRRVWGGVLAAVAVVAVAFGLGMRERDKSAGQPGAAGAPSAVEDAARPAVESAVLSSLADTSKVKGGDGQFIQAQLGTLKERETPEQLKARLDALAADSKAQAAHNRDIYNKVVIEPGAAGRPTENPVRRAVQGAVALASAQAGEGSFVSALKQEGIERAQEMRSIVVRPGDTLSSISERAYGSPNAYPRIFAANPLVLASPHHIFPGQVLRVPLTKP